MGFTPYDWNENIQHRLEYVETRLRQGSPVAGLRFDGGVLLLSLRKSQRKVFEVFDHILFAGIGSQSDVEGIRIASIDFAHQEAFNRSPDDVSVQRLAAGLSPTLKKAFGDGFNSPFVFRGLFAEIGREPDRDQFTALNYDGEYSVQPEFGAIAGSGDAEKRMQEVLGRHNGKRLPLDDAIRLALEAWTEGRSVARRLPPRQDGREEEDAEESGPETVLSEALKEAEIEVGVLERHGKTVRFHLVPKTEIERIRR